MWFWGNNDSLEGKVIVLTGATGGLSSGLARIFKAKNARLALLDIDKPKLEAMATELGPDVARSWYADVRDLRQLENAMKEVHTHFGKIDVVLAIAGIETFDPTLELSEERWLRIMDINVNGVWRTFKAALPYVKETKGYLGAVSSMAAFLNSAFFGAYCASKASVFALANSVRAEMRIFGVSVGTFHPMFFDSGLVAGVECRPAWRYLYSNHEPLMLRKVPVALVQQSIAEAVEKRSEFLVLPWFDYFVAWLAPLVRPLVDRSQAPLVAHTYELLAQEKAEDKAN